MKKLIAMTSVVMCIGFSIALANSNDTSQSPGTSGMSNETSRTVTDTTTSTTDSANKDSSMSKDMSKDSWKTASTCTTEKGEVLHRKDKGFKSCIETMQKKSGGMSGQSGSSTTESTTTEESNTDHSSDMGGKSGSSDTSSGY